MSIKLWQGMALAGFVLGYISTPLSAVKAKIIQGAFTAAGFLVVYAAIRGLKGLFSKSDGKIDRH